MIFAVKNSELGCIIGNLFEGLEPPCDIVPSENLIIRGRTFAGNKCALTIHNGYCEYEGNEEDIKAVIDGKCPERRCMRNAKQRFSPCKQG